MVEKRRYPRIAKKLPIKLFDLEFDIVTETKNISGNGAYCLTTKPIPLMTKLNIVILIPLKKKTVKKINCTGVVIRQDLVKDNGRQSYCAGIYFSEINEKDRKLLLSFINPILQSAKIIPS